MVYPGANCSLKKSWETNLWVTLVDFMVKCKSGKGNLDLSENQVSWNNMLYLANNHN